MPRLPLHPSSGTGEISKWAKQIRLVRYGCANRPFFHIVVMNRKEGQHRAPIEQLGTFDPMTNRHNEKLIALNFERIQYWLGQNVTVSKPIAVILGLAGFFPIHPKTYMKAWRNRRAADKAEANEPSDPETEADKKIEAAG